MYGNKQRYQSDGGRWDLFKSQLNEEQKWQIKDIRECLKYGLSGPQWRSEAKSMSQAVAYELYEADKHASFYELAEQVMLRLDYAVDPDSTLAEYCPRTVRRTHTQRPVPRGPFLLLPGQTDAEINIITGEEFRDMVTVEIEEEHDSEEEQLAPMVGLSYSSSCYEADPKLSPFCSENHVTTLKLGELLIGGMPKKHPRPKGKKRVYVPTATRKGPGRHTIVRSPGLLLPSELRMRLLYTAVGTVTNAGSRYAGQRWHTDAPYDVDPILGTSAMPGYAEAAALYHFQRTHAVRVRSELLGNETFPVTTFAIHSNNDLGTGGSTALLQAGNPMCQTLLLAPNGHGGTKRLNSRHTICQIVGSNAPLVEDNYRSLTNAIPADLTWFGLYVDAGPVNTLTANKGIQYTLQIEFDILFYGRNILTA